MHLSGDLAGRGRRPHAAGPLRVRKGDANGREPFSWPINRIDIAYRDASASAPRSRGRFSLLHFLGPHEYRFRESTHAITLERGAVNCRTSGSDITIVTICLPPAKRISITQNETLFSIL